VAWLPHTATAWATFTARRKAAARLWGDLVVRQQRLRRLGWRWPTRVRWQGWAKGQGPLSRALRPEHAAADRGGLRSGGLLPPTAQAWPGRGPLSVAEAALACWGVHQPGCAHSGRAAPLAAWPEWSLAYPAAEHRHPAEPADGGAALLWRGTAHLPDPRRASPPADQQRGGPGGTTRSAATDGQTDGQQGVLSSARKAKAKATIQDRNTPLARLSAQHSPLTKGARRGKRLQRRT
jgi:hypothetical protein